MTKEHYKKELEIDGILKKGSEGKDVEKVQEWLNLWKYCSISWSYSVTIDGDFGPQTESMVRIFQAMNLLKVDGVVGPNTFGSLCSPLRMAFNTTGNETGSLQSDILYIARLHLAHSPRELGQNEGPWVRSYMDGYDGAPFAWCLGFGQTVLDQALSKEGRKVTDIMPLTYSCDVLGEHGLKEKCLTRAPKFKSEKEREKIKSGDFFLISKKEHDWGHTGIVEQVDGKWIHVIEGNTNQDGSRNGYEVCRRMRNLEKGNIDIFHLNL